jgi:hemoglobin
MGLVEMAEKENALIEAAITTCVRQFYAKARQDEMLGPIFNDRIEDFDEHIGIVANFWSSVLLKTERYTGHPYPVHVPLPIELEHIGRWLELFTEAAQATLPPPYAEIALARARLMGDSFRVGLFPFVGKDGKPSRHPA